MKQTCIKMQIHCHYKLTLLILVLSKETLIFFVKTKPEHCKWRKHDTRGSMAPFSHLLSFAFGLYMTTATLLNGKVFPSKKIRGHCDPQVVDFGGHFQFERVTY